jgi:hypothetical protein
VPVTVDVKRAAFRQLYSSAVTQANTTLQGALATAIAAPLAATLAGKQVIEAQAEGVVTKYQLPSTLVGGSPDLVAMWGQLQDLYDLALAPSPGGALDAESANLPHAKGAAIYAWMLAHLKPVRAFAADHTNPGFRS